MSNAPLSIVNSTEKFQLNRAGWENILHKTANFTAPEVQTNVLESEDRINFRKWIFDVIRHICINKTNAYGFRVYLNSEIVNKDYLTENVYSHIPAVESDGTQWIEDVFQDQKFGIILNFSEKFSMPMADRLSALIHPLLDHLGVPSNGMHTTVFIGNYGFTPLGIHQDHFGANVIHFHLGPGDKTMYTWEAGLFESLDGKNKPLAELLPLANAYHFEQDDLFFMPWDQYHIGQTDDLSVGLTVWFDNHSNHALAERLLKSITMQMDNENLQEITKMQHGIADIDYNSVEEIFKNHSKIADLPFKDLLKEVFSDFKMALFSNCGWTSIPITMEQISDDFKVDENFGLLDNVYVQLPYPFQLYYTRTNAEDITIYARGAKITIRFNPLLEDIINQLNTNEIFHTGSLLKQLNEEWPPQAGLYFLALLYNKRALYITD
ncbi:hypothetical protein HDE69_001772 [Pedobacter cryoconitis]|uniref:JmjC domain-containing protein n=1 Tax=Pedobacter cryoconitis TaxID=188932 RepID=A0A7W9DJ19_9SPHI|nr:hypothetical protein [Pedobacter cryoconitis]MBB5620723.1 hypothetical protein [Pedobacter cryoconitis]